MNIDETVKALRDKLTPNGTITLDVDGVGYILDMIERMGNLVEKYECEVIPDYHKVAEQLQAENSMLKSGNKQIIEDYKLCIAERDELKANQPVRCGECMYSAGDDQSCYCEHGLGGWNLKADDFCSYGERRDAE